MRGLLTAALISACGGGVAQRPVETAIENHETPKTAVADPALPADAAVPADPDADIASDGPPQPGVADRLAEISGEDPTPPPADPAPPDGVEVDSNGVAFVRSKERIACLVGGRKEGLCFSPKECGTRTASFGGRCTDAKAWACLSYSERTSGKRRVVCLSTAELCESVKDALNASVEALNVTDCVIFRR